MIYKYNPHNSYTKYTWYSLSVSQAAGKRILRDIFNRCSNKVFSLGARVSKFSVTIVSRCWLFFAGSVSLFGLPATSQFCTKTVFMAFLHLWLEAKEVCRLQNLKCREFKCGTGILRIHPVQFVGGGGELVRVVNLCGSVIVCWWCKPRLYYRLE